MSEIESDDSCSRATEDQMRRSLGLRQGSSSPARFSNSETHHHKRHQFVRDGDVQVEVLHGHDGGRVNQLDATRQALQAQIAGRDEAERLLTEARHTIHDLQTKLGHERLARDEAVQRVEAAKAEVEQELVEAREDLEAERLLRLATAKERDQAILGRQAAEDRLRQAKEMRKTVGQPNTVPTAEPLLATQPRRRGRPPKVNRDDSEVVEWWTPGWKDRYR
jgi:hypothetical protein